MSLASFSDERLKMIVSQPWNYSDEKIKSASEELIIRNTISAEELAQHLEKGELEKLNRLREESRKIALEESKFFNVRKLDRLMPGLVFLSTLAISGIIYIFTGWIFIFALAPLAALGSTRR